MTSVPKVSDVQVYAGDTLRLEYTMKAQDGTPVDLTGWTFTSDWQQTAGDRDVIPFTVDHSALAVGTVVLTMSPAQTARMRAGQFDLQGVQGDQVRTFLRGNTAWMKDVTP